MAIRGKIYTAGPFTDEQVEEVTRHFCNLLGQDVHLRQDRDESLLGGFVVHIGGVAYDASLKARLADLRAHMLEEEE
jgi:F-type H+-transporting ATPase subunit delta